ncbi:MAG: NAD-dependent epimerase/dehydratase family protein [Thermoleophilia bacterium]
MKILITGGAGFIGSHSTELFAGDGHEVTVVDNFSTGKLSNLSTVESQIRIIDLDIRDTGVLSDACRGIDVILHLAAVSSVEKSIMKPLETHEINTAGTLSVLEAARENKARRVVFSSSAAVYGDDPQLPKTESSPVRPLSPYAWHKLTGEFYGRHYQLLHGIEFLALRYFNVYGPRQDPASPYSGVLSIFNERSRRGETLTIFGDGEQTRDFIHVGDIAAVNLLAARNQGNLPEIINVSTGRETRIIDIASAIQAGYGDEKNIRFEEERQGDIRRSYASTELLARELGYEARVKIEQGLLSLRET